MWGLNGKVVQAQATAAAAQVRNALACLQKVLEYRNDDIKKHARDRRCGGECPPERNCRD